MHGVPRSGGETRAHGHDRSVIGRSIRTSGRSRRLPPSASRSSSSSRACSWRTGRISRPDWAGRSPLPSATRGCPTSPWFRTSPSRSHLPRRMRAPAIGAVPLRSRSSPSVPWAGSSRSHPGPRSETFLSPRGRAPTPSPAPARAPDRHRRPDRRPRPALLRLRRTRSRHPRARSRRRRARSRPRRASPLRRRSHHRRATRLRRPTRPRPASRLLRQTRLRRSDRDIARRDCDASPDGQRVVR